MLLRASELDTLSDLLRGQAREIKLSNHPPEVRAALATAFEELGMALLTIRDTLWGNQATNSR